MKISPEESERRRQLAIELHRQGRFGGKQPGSGRPRKKRASEEVAAAASQHTEEITKAFVDALKPGRPDSVRVSAAKEWLKIERDEAELQIKEDRALEGKTSAEMIDMIVTRLAKAAAHNSLPDTFSEFLEAEVVVEEEEDEDDDGDEEDSLVPA